MYVSILYVNMSRIALSFSVLFLIDNAKVGMFPHLIIVLVTKVIKGK